VRDLALVRIGERGPDRSDDVVGFADLEALGHQVREHVAQRFAVEPLSCHVVLLAVAAELEHASNVRMVESPQLIEVALQRGKQAAAPADVSGQHP
jgi:hypothetical protein